MTLLYLVAGEQSGDELGARLMAALLRQRAGLRFAGIGGAGMAAQGLESRVPLEELALMGLVEVLPRLRRVRRILAQTAADIAALRPAAVVTIDSPAFTLRLLHRIAATGIPRAHYVAPQVWAWRPGRVRRYPGLWNRLLCLLPFEPEFFARHGLPAAFVGHPVLESGADHGDADGFRARHALPPEAKVIAVLPGSRRTETARLLPILGAALDRLAVAMPGLRPVVPLAGPVAETVRGATRNWATEPVLVADRQHKHDAFAASAAALTKSGTSTLELALAGVPMLVAYRVNPLSAMLARRLVNVPYASLLNLLSRRELVPELLQEACTPARLADALYRLLSDPAAAAAQRQGFRAVLDALRPPVGLPSEAAATAVLELIDQA